MPRTTMKLGFFVFCFANSLIFAVAVSNDDGTSGNSTGSIYFDATRRNENLFTADFKNQESTTTKDKMQSRPQTLTAKAFDQPPKEELTGFETEAPCDNAQFLMKILTVLIPLLRNEVPASTRTSYILYILKDLLKSSSEAAKDNEIMNKINDLLETLDTYHDREYVEKKVDALRQLNTVVSNPVDFKSKVVFKYEMPQLENTDCTAKLLSLLQIVQKAITRLVNNPLCNSTLSESSPQFFGLQQYLENPDIYSNEKILLPNAKNSFEEQEYPVSDIDIPEFDLQYRGNKLDKNMVFPKVVNDINKGKPNHYGKSPYQQKQRWLPIVPHSKELYGSEKYPYDKNTVDSSHQISILPDIYVPQNNIIVSKQANTPSFNMPLRPKTLPKKLFDVVGDGSGELQMKPITQYLDYNSNLPKELYRPETIAEYDFQVSVSSPSPLDIYGDDISTEIQIGPNKPKHPLNDLISSERFLDVFGSPSNAYISLNKHLHGFDVNDIMSKKKPEKQPYKYDSSPQNLPIERGDIPFHRPKRPLNPYLPNYSTNRVPNKNGPYNPYLLKPDYKPSLELAVIGDGSGKIQLSPQIKHFSTYKPKYSYSHTEPQLDSPEIRNFKYKTEYYRPKESDFMGLPKILKPNEVDILNGGKIITSEPITNDLNTKPDIQNSYTISEEIIPYKELPDNSDYPEIENLKYNMEYYRPKESDFMGPPKILKPDEVDILSEGKLITSEPITNDLYTKPDIQNSYTISEEIIPYKELPDNSDSLPHFVIPEKIKPKLWEPDNIPSKISQPQLMPDNKMLLIIKDNIQVIEDKIPTKHMNIEIREMIRNLKQLLNLKQITVEEYVNIIKQYQVLIEYVKKMNISSEIIRELLLNIINLDKLNFINGKPQVIELTYLIKRPEPLVYQPYYYIKYKIPYSSFLQQVAINPHSTTNPEKLHKDLISMSEIAETSPDLQKYGEEDIIRLTFNKGTLVGAKVIKEKEQDVFNSVNKLKNISFDLSVNDVYELIQKLNAYLKHNSDSLVIEDSNIPTFNIDSHPNKIPVMEVKKLPFIQQVTKITTNQIGSDKTLEYLLDKVNVLRSNATAQHKDKLINSTLEKNIHEPNDSIPPIGRSRDIYNMNRIYNSFTLSDDASNNIKSDGKKIFPEGYLKVLKDLNYYSENGGVELYGPKSNMIHKDDQYLNQMQYIKNTSSPKQTMRWDEIINVVNKKPTSYESNSVDSSNLIKSSKVDPYFNPTSVDSSNNYKHNEYGFHQYQYDTGPIETSVSTHKIIGNPNSATSHLVEHSKTYINNIPVEHSETYLVEKPNNEVKQFEASYTDPIKYNIKYSQSVIDNNPLVGNYNLNPREYQQTSSVKETVESQTLSRGNSYLNFYDSVNDKPREYKDMNLQQLPVSNLAHGKNFAQYQTYLSNPYISSRNNLMSNVRHLGMYPRGFIPNNIINRGYRNVIDQKLPSLYRLHRRPLISPFLG